MRQNQLITKNNLRTLRKQHAFKQKDVAKLLGMQSEDRISHWEKGIALPGLINLFKLSMVYEVSPYELYPKLLEEVKNSLIQRLDT